MPAVFAALALTLLAAAHWKNVTDVGVGLALAGLVAVAAGGALTCRENLQLLRRSQRESLTDALTGLGNRRRLMSDIDAALTEANAGRPHTLLFFELDGFKGYSDASDTTPATQQQSHACSRRPRRARVNWMHQGAAPRAFGGRMRVAIVDDHAGIRRLLAEVLARETGVEIVGDATDGDEVPAMVEATAPDLVIMDFVMPRVDGLAATTALHAAHPSVEIVAFTSTADPAIVSGFLTSGATRHFEKTQIDELTEYVAARAGGAGA